MENPDASLDLKEFIKKIIAIVVGLMLIAGVVSLSINLSFGIILFALGMLSAVVGASLGRANPYDPKNPYEKPSPAKLSARILYDLRNAVPQSAFENILMFAGLIAILSMPFLCQIMFS